MMANYASGLVKKAIYICFASVSMVFAVTSAMSVLITSQSFSCQRKRIFTNHNHIQLLPVPCLAGLITSFSARLTNTRGDISCGIKDMFKTSDIHSNDRTDLSKRKQFLQFFDSIYQ